MLAEQHELEYVDFAPSTVDVAAALLLPASLARRYRALPIRCDADGSVLVAVADPTNVLFSDEPRLAVGRPVRICVGTRHAIERAITVTIEGEPDPDEAPADCCVPAGRARQMLRTLGVGDVPHDSSFVVAGRVPLFEAMTMTDEIALLFGAQTREIEAMAGSQGMTTLRDDGIRLAAAGVTTLEEVRRVVGETPLELVPMRAAAAGVALSADGGRRDDRS